MQARIRSVALQRVTTTTGRSGGTTQCWLRPRRRVVGRVLIRTFGRPAQHSQVQAADQHFDRAAQLSGQVLEDLPQGADPQGLVGWNGEVLLLAVDVDGSNGTLLE